MEKKKMHQELSLEKARIMEDFAAKKRGFEQEKLLWENEKVSEISNLKGSLLVKHEQDIAKVKHDSKEELLKKTQVLQDEFSDKLKKALEEVHTKGNVTTKFMNDIAIKMLEAQAITKNSRMQITANVGDDV